MAELGVAASIIAVVQLAGKVVSILHKYGDTVKSAKDDISRLNAQLNCVTIISESAQQLLGNRDGVKLESFRKLHVALEEVQSQLRILERELGQRRPSKVKSQNVLTWPFSARQVEKVARDLERSVQAIAVVLQIDQTSLLLQLDRNTSLLDTTTLLSKLPFAEGAACDSHAEEHESTCHPQTRNELLQEISQWAEDHCSLPVFWLNGMAGTGKSTICRTVTQSFAAAGVLGASFFFRKGEDDRNRASKLITTIAAQLVVNHPALATYIKTAVSKHPLITQKSMRDQFDKLIIGPLSNAPASSDTTTIVIVVDALDECDDEDDIRLLIHLFANSRSASSCRPRFFVTSRPELSVRLGFNAIKNMYCESILDEVPLHTIKKDIGAFLADEFKRIRTEFNDSVSDHRRLPQSWPAETNVQTLAETASPLFIFATTVCRYLADRKTGNPQNKLKNILDNKPATCGAKLDATYLPILEQQLVGLCPHERRAAIHEFQTIVGSIVLLSSPLTTSALAALLDMPKFIIDDRLDLLHSVLKVSSRSDSLVRPFHRSFRDFLLDPTHCDRNSFWVDKEQLHQKLTKHCIRVMEDGLSNNMCGLQWPGTPISAIDPQKVREALSEEVQYACIFWTRHLRETRLKVDNDNLVLKFLTGHFTRWVEASSLLKRTPDCLSSIEILQSLIAPDTSPELDAFLSDANRFLHAYMPAITTAPLQVYYSALFFAPEMSAVRKAFSEDLPDWISVLGPSETRWGQFEQTIEGHSDEVTSVSICRDSRLLISGSRDRTVRIWLLQSGELQRTLKGHKNDVRSVAFSHDAEFVASGSADKTVRIWSTSTGELQRVLEHGDPVSAVVFSHDSTLLATASNNNAVRIWSTGEGAVKRVLEGHRDVVNSVVFSHDSALLASASDDRTVRVWSASTGKTQRIIEGHKSLVTSVAFSHNSLFLASGSFDHSVRIWSTNTGELMWHLNGHVNPVTSVAFSPSSALVSSASFDESILIWSTTTGERKQTLKGHHGWVTSISFASNSTFIASASADRTIRIWPTEATVLQRTLEEQHPVSTNEWSAESTYRQSTSHERTNPMETAHVHENCTEIKIEVRSERYPLNHHDINTLKDLASMVGQHCQVLETGPNPFDNHKDGCSGPGISRDGKWLTWEGKNTLWLPLENRPWCSAMSGSSIIMGCHWSKIYMISFDR